MSPTEYTVRLTDGHIKPGLHVRTYESEEFERPDIAVHRVVPVELNTVGHAKINTAEDPVYNRFLLFGIRKMPVQLRAEVPAGSWVLATRKAKEVALYPFEYGALDASYLAEAVGGAKSALIIAPNSFRTMNDELSRGEMRDMLTSEGLDFQFANDVQFARSGVEYHNDKPGIVNVVSINASNPGVIHAPPTQSYDFERQFPCTVFKHLEGYHLQEIPDRRLPEHRLGKR